MVTERRLVRISKVLSKRQEGIIIALDRLHDPHNVSAILRTADAVGIITVLWLPDPECEKKINPEVAKGSEKWIELKIVDNLFKELVYFKQQGYKIATTHLSVSSVDFRDVDWTQKWVIVVGNEHSGCTDEILELSDVNILLPMYGFVQSLNVSVATAVILYEIQRQRQNAGLYNKLPSFSTIEKLYRLWKLDELGLELDKILHSVKTIHLNTELPPYEHYHQNGRHKKCKK